MPVSVPCDTRSFCESWATDVARYDCITPVLNTCYTLKRPPAPTHFQDLPFPSSTSRPVKRKRLHVGCTKQRQWYWMPTDTSASYTQGKRGRSCAPPETTLELLECDVALELNATPRAFVRSSIIYPDQTRPFPLLVPTDNSTDRDTTDSTGASPISKKTRSRSPKKSALQYGYENFDFRDFTLAQAAKFPPSLLRMRRAFTDYSDSLGILPLRVRAGLRADRQFQESLDERPRRDAFYDTGGTRDELGEPLTFHEALELAQESRKCKAAASSESGWNSHVHIPLLKMSLQRCAHSATTLWEDLRSASIQPASLCPRVTIDSITSHKVDFGLVLRLPLSATTYLRRNGPAYLNQTHYNLVRHSPITVSIETKISGAGYEGALTQVAVWAFAQFAHLRNICGEVPPFLPLLIVQGDDWYFAAATQSSFGDVVQDSAGGDNVGNDSEHETVIWDKLTIGNTNSVEGIWKISCVLQYLAQWSATEYANWLRARLNLVGKWPLPEFLL